ncbi:beta/gamma crystallin domain-containing protein [Azohydromonas lata]|uniref:beta/gamma crystallin domain-containing protein n=1 Tax=Azohydromonas lata TaxID=45677 RepID=UPI001472279F|nr:beta/gamma crystallin domain-containing protein [Azohydromonas lata]
MAFRKVAAATAVLLALSGAVMAQGTAGDKKPDRSPQATAPVDKGTVPKLDAVLVLMPAAQGSSESLGNGCWVRFYDGENYHGASLTLVGPIDMPKMDVPGPAWREWDSAVVGPKARVITYDNENYRDRTATLAAGQHYPKLDDSKLGWFEEIHSARVSCTG